MGQSQYLISVEKCPETGVFVGTSEDIPGLTLEADTIGQILDAAMDVVPHLLRNNLGLADLDGVVVDVAVHLAPAGRRRPEAVGSADVASRFAVEPVAAYG